jgi:NAD(P)-dependent dehydrogenase (short-subunit alcohol dehydrogenase family)
VTRQPKRRTGLGGAAEATRLDVADAEAVAEVVEATYQRHGRLDFLFNNAGIGATLPIERIDLDHWQRTLEVNLGGVIHGSAPPTPTWSAKGSVAS